MSNRTFVGAFRAIDRAIVNPLWMLMFMGAPVLTGVAGVLYLRDDDHSVLPWVAVAFGLYLAVIVITVAVHVPLNDDIKAAGDADQITNLAAVRGAFHETRWVTWNLVRAVATWALVLHGRATATAANPLLLMPTCRPVPSAAWRWNGAGVASVAACHSHRGVAAGSSRAQCGAMDEIRVGLLLPTREAHVHGWDARRILDVARRAEALGFASLWAGDSLRRPRYEPLVVLAAVAAVTEQAELGTAALMPAFRQPLGAAASLASIDALSGGRLIVAVGAGFPGLSEDELALVGVPYRQRFRWLDDVVSLWRTVWSAEPAPGFTGDVLQPGWLPDVPRPYRAGGPPVWLAGATPAALARAGRWYDGWIPYPPDPVDYASGLAALRSAVSSAGRDADDVTPAMYLTVIVDDDAERGHRAAEEWCLRWYELPFEMVSSVQAFVIGSAADVAARIARYVQAGARHIVVRMASVDPEEDLALVADVVLRAQPSI